MSSSTLFYVDLDGVLVNFDKEFQKHMQGLTEEDDWTWQELYRLCPDIYAIAEPMPDAYILWKHLLQHGIHNLRILTAIPKRWNWPEVTKHKRNWVKEKFGLPEKQVLFGPYAEDKQYHCSGPSDILIDDKIINIHQWVSRGGIGIHHESAIETIRKLEYMSPLLKFLV